MSIRKLLLAGAGALVLQSCATPQPPLTAADLLSTPYALPSGRAFDVEAFFAALPDWLSVTYANASFDSAIGAMVVDDLIFELAAAPGYRLRADHATIWDADVEAMANVFNGAADLTQMSHLFDRLAFENVYSEGLQWDGGAQSLGLSIDKLVMDGVAARSFALAPKDSAADGAIFIRTVAAIANSYAYDGVAYSNFSFQMNDNQGNSASYGVDQIFARGYDAGRVDYYSGSGLRTKSSGAGNGLLTEVSQVFAGGEDDNPQDKILQPNVREQMREVLKNPVAVLASLNGGMSTEHDIQFFEVRDMDVRGALSWLARWELPPITETELLDFGASTIIGDKQSLDGKLFYQGGRIDVAAFDFYWLIPSSFNYSETGSRMDIAALFDAMGETVPEGADELAKVYDAVAALGLEQISFDAMLDWAWDGETGDAALQTDTDVVDFVRMGYGARLGGPSLARWDALVRSDQMETAIQEMSLGGFNFSITDYQMLDRVFAYAAQQSGSAPEDLRLAAPAMMRLSGAQVAQMNPRIPGYIDAIVNFIESGGTLSVNIDPAEPIPFIELQSLSQSPQTLPDVLNLTVTHSE
jgi:hypothetical protein